MATTTTITDVVAVEATDAVIGDNGTATIQAGTTASPNTNSATGSTVEGDADILADTQRQVGALDSTFVIGNAATISVSEVSTTAATGTSVDGTADAVATYSGDTGGILDMAGSSDDIQIGAGAVIGVTVDNTATAAATTTAADATAEADFAAGSYGLLDTDVTAGAGGSLIANLDANASATAITVGPIGGAADASATASFSDVTAAIYDSGAGAAINIGDGGTVIGTAGVTADPLSLTAVATTTSGGAEASASATDIVGIGGIDTQIAIGNDATITGAAVVAASSAATTVDADNSALVDAANADTSIDLVAALGTGDGDVTVGADASITAVAASTSSATAASTDGAGTNTVASVTNDLVTGIDLDTVTVGDSGSLTVSASSAQTATASTVAAVGGGADEARASVAGLNEITGVNDTAVSFGNDASKFSVTASLTGTATSSNVNGAASDSEAGVDSAVTGILDGSVTVGNSLTGVNGLRVDAISNLTAVANGVAGTADADAGSANVNTVAAIDGSTVDVANSGNITAVAASNVTATASTTADDATANAYQIGDGLLDTAVTVGNDGNLTAQATLVGNATATTVGPNGGAADATADLILDANGISQTNAETITIGDVGNVTANAFASGGAIAQTTNGSAEADASVDVQGLDLATSANDITINGAGTVTGLGVIGTLVNGALGSQIQVTAAAVSGDATADGTFTGAGILGDDATITAGPRDGDISGQVFAGANVVASTTGTSGLGDAQATINPSELYGIAAVDMTGGQVGTNLVRGTAFGDFDATATSVAGDATGDSDVSVYGIFGGAGGNSLDVSGNVLAVAQLSNTVTATTVQGNATATATSNAVGLSNYNVTILSGGNLTASAISNASSTATSVAGDV